MFVCVYKADYLQEYVNVFTTLIELFEYIFYVVCMRISNTCN